MTSQLLVPICTLIGVLIGGLINYLATTRSKDREWRLGLTRERILERQKTYADFLVAAQRLAIQAIEQKVPIPTRFDEMNTAFARVELVASEPVVAAAKRLCGHVFDSHKTQPPETRRALHQEKSEFIKAARLELKELEGV